MEMHDMKLSKKKKKEVMSTPETAKAPEYPWGLSLNLKDDSIVKLGVGKMKAGDIVSIKGLGKITNITVNDSDREGGKNQSMTIQIQKLGVENADYEETFKREGK